MWQPEFDPEDPHGTRREPTPKHSSPAFTHVSWYACVHTHTHIKMHFKAERLYETVQSLGRKEEAQTNDMYKYILWAFKQIIYCTLYV